MNVLDLRQRLGLGSKEFARLVGCSYSTLYSWERQGVQPDGALLTILEAFDTASQNDTCLAFLKACAANGSGLGGVLLGLFDMWATVAREQDGPT